MTYRTIRTRIHSLLGALNFILPKCLPSFPEVGGAPYKIEQDCITAQRNRPTQL